MSLSSLSDGGWEWEAAAALRLRFGNGSFTLRTGGMSIEKVGESALISATWSSLCTFSMWITELDENRRKYDFETKDLVVTKYAMLYVNKLPHAGRYNNVRMRVAMKRVSRNEDRRNVIIILLIIIKGPLRRLGIS